MNLFIDTNILLSFYHFSSEDLEELNKLNVLLQRNRVVLFTTEQVKMEFERNRAAKIADGLKRFREQKLALQFPQFCKDYDEYSRLQGLQKDFEAAHAALLARVSEDVARSQLKADRVINNLFALGTILGTTPVILERARNREAIGNPPGKADSLGDAINWESLLEATPHGEDLYLVTDDRDFSSPLDEDSFNPFLAQEWSAKKNSEIRFYRRLSGLFRDQFPDIKLATELEKSLLIADLANSPNFGETHRVIARLRTFSDFTSAEANDILNAAITNTQVYWIINDEDVRRFLEQVVTGREAAIAPESLKRLRNLLEHRNDAEE